MPPITKRRVVAVEQNRLFAYILKLKPEYQGEEALTDKVVMVANQHLDYLRGLHEEGKVVLLGRSVDDMQLNFSIVVLRVGSRSEAESIMKADPILEKEIMTAELFPFEIDLMG